MVHNDGRPTFRQSNVATAPDVTFSVGLMELGPVRWSVVDDELRTPHEGILITVDERPDIKVEVVDWPKFDWDKYSNETEDVLGELHEKWVNRDFQQLDSDVYWFQSLSAV